MEIRTYCKILIRRWWLVVTPIAVVAVYVVATYASPQPAYQVVMRFAAGTEPVGLSLEHDRYYPWLTSEYIANGLADVAETGVFAEAVATRVGDPGLSAAINAGIVTDNAQSVLVVYLTWHDPDQIIALADAITAELTEGGAAYFPQLTGVEPAVRRLDSPAPRQLAPGLRSQLMGPAIKLGLAIAVGVALALLWHYLDPTLREVEELEALGIEVLAQIPRRR